MARVLVVDDDPFIVGLVQTRLRSNGHQTLSATTAAEALDLVAERGAPDLVVLDVDMPELTGLELLGRLRADLGDPRLPAVFLSARVQPDDIEAGRAMGASYLTKPFVASALLKAIDTLLRPQNASGEW